MGWREELETIDGTLKQAKQIPLTDQVLIGSSWAQASFEALRAALPAGVERPTDWASGIGDVGTNLEALRVALVEAPPVPLTRQLRVDREHAYDLIDRLLAAIPSQALMTKLLALGQRGGDAGLAIGNAQETFANLRDLILGSKLINLSRIVKFDGLEALNLIGALRSQLSDVESTMRAAGVAGPGKADTMTALDLVATAVQGGKQAASFKETQLRRRDIRPVLDKLDGELDALIYATVY